SKLPLIKSGVPVLPVRTTRMAGSACAATRVAASRSEAIDILTRFAPLHLGGDGSSPAETTGLQDMGTSRPLPGAGAVNNSCVVGGVCTTYKAPPALTTRLTPPA